MKKRILFVVTYFDCGGITSSLKNLLNVIDTEIVEVDVFSMVDEGNYASELKNCRVVQSNRCLDALVGHYNNKTGFSKMYAAIIKSINKASKDKLRALIYKRITNNIKSKKYDAVIAFSEGAPTEFISYLNHSNKIAWIHCDYASYKSMSNGKDETVFYSSYKKIICVSNYTRSSFVKFFPEMGDKTEYIYNILDSSQLIKMSTDESDIRFDDKIVNLISVGRLDPVKQLSIIPYMANCIKERGCSFCWYVIGPKGGSEDEYNKLIRGIKECNVSDYVIYIGEQRNPYCYIANADILVSTSKSEACPYVINEAKILHTPVVCTNFGSASEFVENNVNGLIVTQENMPGILASLIDDMTRREMLKSNLKQFEWDNQHILNQFYSII